MSPCQVEVEEWRKDTGTLLHLKHGDRLNIAKIRASYVLGGNSHLEMSDAEQQ